MANQPETVPFHIRTEPFKKDYQDNILIEIAIYLMKHAKGNFDPENVTLKVNTQRGLYTAWLPQVLVDLLVEMPAPKKFPAHLCTNATFHFLPWKPEAVRLWMTIAQPESAPSIPTTILKITLNNILNNHGLAITELKPNLSKNTDVKCLTGVYYVSLNYNKDLLRDSSDTSTLEDLKHITIKEAHWKVELSNTVTHKLDLCIKCYRPLPKDHPAVLNKPTLLDHSKPTKTRPSRTSACARTSTRPCTKSAARSKATDAPANQRPLSLTKPTNSPQRSQTSPTSVPHGSET